MSEVSESGASAPKKGSRKKRIAKFVVKLAVSLAALYFAYTKIDFQAFKENLREANLWWFALAVLSFNGSKIIAALRLRQFYANVGLVLGHVYNLKLYYLGMFYNLFLPGAIGGDAYKVYILRGSEKIKTKSLIWATLADRISGLCLLVVLGGGFYFASHFPIWEEHLITIGVIAAVLFCLPAFYFGFRWILDKQVVQKFWKTTSYSFWVQLGQVASAMCLLYALHVDANYMDYLTLFMLSSVAAVIPLTIAGVGMRELVFLYGTSYLLISEDKAVAFALLFFFSMAISSLFGVIFAFKPIDQDISYP
ncbi:lysylphosphatidylglycerol synthase transmembrane domain-containing protein [Luteibaculum oceani]|uniref:Flippase-like domain-containing protein n=1 Tax=Luteibaculum oceani TaxID=1294296 RepID=A0A5C6UVD1_9FLAO|nr:lysylphosphatidylglycerol synthase transmembrane domain-containing protein [Luteibaculum oceani]TXC76909.1 flippase-like domain-containing protein [Luteibaculum oceani]